MLIARHKKSGWKRGDMLVLPSFKEVWIILEDNYFLEISVLNGTVIKQCYPAKNISTKQYIGNIKDVCATLGVDYIDISCYNIKEDK